MKYNKSMAEILAEIRTVQEQEDPVQKAQDKLDKAKRISDLKKQIDDIKTEEDEIDEITMGALSLKKLPTLRGTITDKQLQNLKKVWAKKSKRDVTPSLKNMLKKLDAPTRAALANANINVISKLVPEALDDDDKETIKPIIKQLKKSVVAHDKQAKQLTKDIQDETDLEEFTSSQIARLKKEYEPLRGMHHTELKPERFKQLSKMMQRMKKPQLQALVKADVPVLSSAAKASLVINHGMKFSSIKEELIPYLEVFPLDEEKKSKFKSVEPQVIDRIEKMMKGSRAEKDSIANMLNYMMPPEVVDMVRYKLKIVPKRGKIRF